MGAINYGSNEYVNLGLDINKLQAEYEDAYGLDNELYNEEVSYLYDVCKNIIDDYSFDNFKVDLQCGYYDGFYVLPDTYFDFSIYEDEKKDLRVELSNLKECLTRLATEGSLVSYGAGWVTAYFDLEKTLKDIQDTIYKMDEEIEKIPIIDDKEIL